MNRTSCRACAFRAFDSDASLTVLRFTFMESEAIGEQVTSELRGAKHPCDAICTHTRVVDCSSCPSMSTSLLVARSVTGVGVFDEEGKLRAGNAGQFDPLPGDRAARVSSCDKADRSMRKSEARRICSHLILTVVQYQPQQQTLCVH